VVGIHATHGDHSWDDLPNGTVSRFLPQSCIRKGILLWNCYQFEMPNPDFQCVNIVSYQKAESPILDAHR
jgi:hypothetical protein